MTNTTLNSKSNIFNHIEAIIATPSLVREQWLSSELAVREVLAFERRFGSKHLLLACHAALPLILTPELLNLIRINFLEEEQIPWVAEVDFLLSSLCRPIDEGLFEVEPSVREVLLVELENQYGFERPFELAKFLQVYLVHQSGWEQRSEVTRTQWWIAQAYIAPDRVVEDLTKLLESTLSEENYLLSIPEQIQVVTALEILAEPLERSNKLREYNYLINNSRVLAQILYKDEPIIQQSLKRENTNQQVENREPMLISPVLVKKLTDSSSSSFNQETTLSSSFNHEPTLDEQLLYAHLLDCVEVESPDAFIDRFRRLFIDDVGYHNPQVWQALKRIVDSNLAEREFKFILSRSCYIPINRWMQQPQLQSAINKLISLFETIPAGLASSQTRQRLRELVQHFIITEQYKVLQRLAQVIIDESEGDSNAIAKPLSTLIHRYPYLYEHCLLSEDSSYEHQQTVRQIQSRVQQRFELDLSQYVTYQVRRAQALRQQSLDELDKIIQPVNNPTLQPVNNPTLLSDRELGAALKQFVGKVQGSCTYRDIAQSFLTHSSQTSSYKEFKDDLYEYLMASIDPAYGKRQFNDRLYTHLTNTLPLCESQKPSEFLIVRTCSQLLNFLVVESPQRPNHFIFVDLITNLGATLTTALLLKIVLLCRKVKPYLEKRFSILFNHYESSTIDGIPWLVKSLENLNIALSIHFGSADLSSLNSIM
jgi:hypothetical protein